MNTENIYKTREEFAHEIGMCARTMTRKLRKLGFVLAKYCLLSPQEQYEIKIALKIIVAVQ